jgi:ribosomal-protein-alanine N-acetyltransferase
MYIETKRLILRGLVEQDAETLFEIKNDEQIMKYPFFKGDETVDFIKIMIAFFQSVESKGLIIDDQDPERGHLFAICLKDSGDVIGVITVHPRELFSEVQMGWYIKSQYTKNGYASEASASASDYLLDALSLDYICACMHIGNIASFRTAQKSGFKIIEKRIPYNEHNNNRIIENTSLAVEYFEKNIREIDIGSYFYFQKYRKTIP